MVMRKTKTQNANCGIMVKLMKSLLIRFRLKYSDQSKYYDKGKKISQKQQLLLMCCKSWHINNYLIYYIIQSLI